jgi:hypothetical protein
MEYWKEKCNENRSNASSSYDEHAREAEQHVE